MRNVNAILTPDTEPERVAQSDAEGHLDASKVRDDTQIDRIHDDSEPSGANDISEGGFKAIEMDEDEVLEASDTKSAQDNIGSEIYDQDTGSKRQNYASLDAGATILDAASEVKNPTNLLVLAKIDTCFFRAKNPQDGLSEDVHAEAITIANFEQFSSPVKDFLILGSLNYPTDTWYVLGNFTAQQIQGEQVFPLNSKQHVRYIKVRLLNHYGAEYYCTLSQIKIYGKSFSQVISQLEKHIEEDVNLVSHTHLNENDLTDAIGDTDEKEEQIELGQCTFSDKKREVEAAQKESRFTFGNETCAANEFIVSGNWNGMIDSRESGKHVNMEAPTESAMDRDSVHENGQASGSIAPSAISYRKANTTPFESSASLTAVPAHQGQGFSRLESIFIRITRKLHMLEINQTLLVKSMEHFQQESSALSGLLQKHEEMFTRNLSELKDLIRAMRLKTEQDENRSNLNRIESQLAIDDLRNDVAFLWNDMMLLREIITTMKAGIVCAIVLSVFVIGFFLLRILFRCLKKCKRRADLRDLLRLLNRSDYDTEDLEYDDASFDALRDVLFDGRGPRFVNREQRFGTSWDDLAIERKTLRQKIIAEPNLFRFLHTRQGSKSSSRIADIRTD
ncbi:hypothetical protein ABG067_004846 [Albugo candida]